MRERWRWIPEYEGEYMVSDRGRVRSHKRASPSLLKQRENRYGYPQVNLYDSEGERRTHVVHRLVLMAFRGAPPDGNEAAHLNGERADNRLENLQWVDREENQRHRELHGTHIGGSNNGNSQFGEVEALSVRLMAQLSGLTQKEIGALYGIGQSSVSQIKNGVTWDYLGVYA